MYHVIESRVSHKYKERCSHQNEEKCLNSIQVTKVEYKDHERVTEQYQVPQHNYASSDACQLLMCQDTPPVRLRPTRGAARPRWIGPANQIKCWCFRCQ